MISNKRRWFILAVHCVAIFICGLTYTWSVFKAPLAEYFNSLHGLTGSGAYQASDFSVIFTVYCAVAIISLIFGGALNDKLGSRWLTALGGVLLIIGFTICSFATEVTTLIIGFGVVTCLGTATCYGCMINSSVKFFPDKKGLAGGLVTACFGLGTSVLSLLASSSLTELGAPATFRIFGITGGVVLILCSFFMIRCPDGYMPAGYKPVVSKATASHSDKTWKEMLKDGIFYVMTLIFASGAFYGVMVITDSATIAMERIGLSSAMAATSVSINSMASIVGRLVCGYASDKIGRINTITALLVLSIISLFLLMGTSLGTVVQFEFSLCLLGFAYGAFMSVFPGFCADQFGIRNNSLNYGIMFVGYSSAGAVAPVLTAALYKDSGSFDSAFYVALAFAAAGILLTFLYRYINHRHHMRGHAPVSKKKPSVS